MATGAAAVLESVEVEALGVLGGLGWKKAEVARVAGKLGGGTVEERVVEGLRLLGGGEPRPVEAAPEAPAPPVVAESPPAVPPPAAEAPGPAGPAVPVERARYVLPMAPPAPLPVAQVPVPPAQRPEPGVLGTVERVIGWVANEWHKAVDPRVQDAEQEAYDTWAERRALAGLVARWLALVEQARGKGQGGQAGEAFKRAAAARDAVDAEPALLDALVALHPEWVKRKATTSGKQPRKGARDAWARG